MMSLFVLMTACVTQGSDDLASQVPINAVVGDASAHALGIDPQTLDEDERIAVHLAYVEGLLRAEEVTGLSPELREARAQNLSRLRAYLEARRFPRNDDHPDRRRPTFVDSQQRICAVGALMAHDLGRDAVIAMAPSIKYDFIEEIRAPIFLTWAARSGLTLRELAMIQPSYWDRPRPRPPEVVLNTQRAWTIFATNLGGCLKAHVFDAGLEYPEPWLPVTVTWGRDGAVTALDFHLSRSPQALDTCVRRAASHMTIDDSIGGAEEFKLVKIPAPPEPEPKRQ